MHEVLVNRLGGLSLPRKSVVRLTDRPDMTLDVYRGRKTTMQQYLPLWKKFLGTQERVRNSRSKRAISVRAIEVLLYLQLKSGELGLTRSLDISGISKSYQAYGKAINTLTNQVLASTKSDPVEGTLRYSKSTDFIKVLRPVVQSIVSLTSSLRGQLVKCFMTL